MRTILGIAIELFEYNNAWRSSVLFLAFFIITIASLQMLEKPNLKVSESDAGRAVEIIADQIGVTEETQEKAKSLIERAKDQYQALKNHKEVPATPENETSTQVDQTTETPQNQTTKTEPTTLDTLNEL
ncbi:MAG: hypothetical protein GY770_13015 [Aestuariibacter sp.]|nr:hypothetical protein [Aestuariibacter sp.]MCP5017407.1 hypothetical protein [Ketobacter sp.]